MGADFSSPLAQAAATVELCSMIQQKCTGDNAQYESLASCAFILGRKEFGSWDEVWGDNVVCRFVHVGLTPMRPEVSYTVVCSLLLELLYSEMVETVVSSDTDRDFRYIVLM